SAWLIDLESRSLIGRLMGGRAASDPTVEACTLVGSTGGIAVWRRDNPLESDSNIVETPAWASSIDDDLKKALAGSQDGRARVLIEARGWPFPALRSLSVGSGLGPLVVQSGIPLRATRGDVAEPLMGAEHVVLPVRPVAYGLTLDTLIYAVS